MKSQYRNCNKTKQPLQKPLSQIMQLEEIIPIINIRLNVVGKWLPCLYKTIHYNFQNIESRITFQICEVSSIISKRGAMLIILVHNIFIFIFIFMT